MNPEDVPAELVQKAALAVAEFTYCGHCDGSCKACTGEARAAIAAVLPDIQAQALREAADDLDLPGSTATGYYASEAVSGYSEAERDIEAWLVKRAARLTDTSEGEEK